LVVALTIAESRTEVSSVVSAARVPDACAAC
jgi:hypothetical protein